MICNIRDRRKFPLRWKSVDAVIEATEYDNSLSDSDYVEPSVPSNWTLVDTLDQVSISEAIQWAEQTDHPVTLFIYDGGAISGPE